MNIMKLAVCGLAFGLAAGVSALGLESGDVILMVRSGVDESAIINMVNNRKLPRPLSAGEVMELTSAGASPALLEFLTRQEASVAAPVMVEPAPQVVAVPQPAPVVVAPPVTYYNPCYSYPQYPRYRVVRHFGFQWDRPRWRGPRSHRPPPFFGPPRGFRPGFHSGFRPGFRRW